VYLFQLAPENSQENDRKEEARAGIAPVGTGMDLCPEGCPVSLATLAGLSFFLLLTSQ